MCSNVYILIVLISLSSWTFADVEFVTEPPKEVRTFPGQNVKLPCVLENLIENHHIVKWAEGESESQYTISKDRDVVTSLVNYFSILGEGMNFTLLIRIPDMNMNDFGTSITITRTYNCSVIEPNGNKVVLTTTSNVIIQKWTFINPICGSISTYYVTGETLTLGCCYNDSDPTIITTLKSDGQVLPTEFDGYSIILNLNVTKEHHNAIFVCESRRNGTNETKSCQIGPITVNYKPEITITQTSPMEFPYTTEDRPPVKVTVEPSIPEDSFTISNEVIKTTEQSKVDFEMKVTSEVENSIEKETKTLNIPVSKNPDEEEVNDSISVGRETKTLNIPVSKNPDDEEVNDSISVGRETKTLNIPVSKNPDDEEVNDSISVVIIVVSVLSCVVAVFVIILLWFLRRKRNQRQHESESKNTVKFGRHDHHQVKMKNQDPKGLVYENDVTNVNEFHAEYQETENEIYVDGLSNDENNADKELLKLEDLDQYRENENDIYEGPNNMDTDSEGQGLKDEKQHIYFQVNKPDYKECENEIYQGPD